jgi:cellulose synthase/poly-beta-1,6-N-acetylglucosamine synthase-like glycosyltransferase/peptidoglycan/xylan/chitin deacetylase (PgdA/CDA1 family)
VNWDARSYYSLKKNINKLNSVYCEWAFLNAFNFYPDYYPDERVTDLLRANNVKMYLLINNYYDDDWQTKRLGEVLSSKHSRAVLIDSLYKIVTDNQFDGINIDFESVETKDQDNLILFQKELYSALHKMNFEISMDLPVNNGDFDYEQFAKYSDKVVLMVYDEHDAESRAGPVAATNWFCNSILELTDQIPIDKIVVGLGAYGYDWPEMSVGEDMTFQEAITTAVESEGNITFDSATSNLHYDYFDDNDKKHDVWFLDAAAMYNEIKSLKNRSSLQGVNGFAFWRLGSEDPSVWSFYGSDSLTFETDIANILRSIPTSSDIDFEGEGDILDVVSTPQDGERSITMNRDGGLINSDVFLKFPSSYVIKKFGQVETKSQNKNKDKKMVLSFDDGPDAVFTPEILDILKVKNVKAAFFVVGINAESNIGVLKRIYDEGHEIGSHSFLHPNIAEVSKERTDLELSTTQRLLESVLGHSTIMFRPPYVADSEPQTSEEILPVVRAKQLGYLTVAESIDPLDWDRPSAQVIIDRVLEQRDLGNIILLHDAGGDRTETVKALPALIDTLRSLGYEFVTVGDLIGKTRDQLMPKVPDSEMYFTGANKVFLESFYTVKNVFVALFYVAIVLGIARLVFILVSVIKDKRISARRKFLSEPDFRVSVIIPALNEEKVIVKCVQSLLECEYKNKEIIVIDDGSKDRTFDVLKEAFEGVSNVSVLRIPNSGKAAALNHGLRSAGGSIIITLDADTVFQPDTITKLVRNFSDKDIAAVAGNVKVGNRHNMLTKWQALEYISSQNLDRRAYNAWNAIIVVPGAVGAYRRTVLDEIGGFSNQTLAEDTDLTMQILVFGYKVVNEPDAIGFTEAPEKIKMLFRQRYRWVYGTLQSFWKHKSAFLNPDNRGFGLVSLPNIIIYQLLMPLIAPLLDFLFILSIISGYFGTIFIYFIVFMIMDMLVGLIAFLLEKEDLKLILYLPFQRILYRQLLYIAVLKAALTAIKGTLVGWRKFERSGKVKVVLEEN